MSTAAALDPLQAAPGGHYVDERVDVRFDGGSLRATARGGRVAVRHGLTAPDDDLAERLADVLADVTDEHDLFARAFVGVVLTSGPDVMRCWDGFYRCSLARLDDPHQDGYTQVYRHALGLLPRTSVLDLGASFGFLGLHLTGLGIDVTCVEPDPGTGALLVMMSRRLDAPVRVEVSSAALPDRVADAVAMLHVLEHVDHATATQLVDEATRLAAQRVVIAVPYEDVPNPLYGHVRCIRPHDLHELGAATGWAYDVHEHCGGWLVLDRT